MHITTDHHSVDQAITSPTDALSALHALDGKNSTQLIASNDNGCLMIGGGNDELYIVTFVVEEDTAFFNLLADARAQDEQDIALVTGGQKGLFPARLCVDKATATEALLYYIEHAAMHPGLNWEQDV
ncbi:Imm1 family immunity protein [Chitinophaga nivalis]|uniref:Imm1 family immunity protein n=1 Tax=Chitinophaga nivalis TaxID=2991709 RepID=A0ABT3IMT2_9BACT|nr:Imm1 family immunity protein [Chitinophaga nivalis]MCW3465044.1 Imm1 family immunity protein [Chitinophaga nivalis]MCW3485264.1 Imm1 family immunity protein [Chitinophaga nivalis]